MSQETIYTMKQPVKAEPLSEVEAEVYEKILGVLDSLNQRSDFNSDKEYEDAKCIIANKVYLIYERLYLDIVREIDYTSVKDFAIKNKNFVKYIFKQELEEDSFEALDNWTHIPIDILECGMYQSTRHFNKHVYH